MKTKLAFISIAALGGFAAFANPASAHPDIRVGIRFGAPAPVVYCPPAPVAYYSAAPVAYCAPAPVVEHYNRPTGYWREVVVQTWVPACYVNSRDWRGRPVRVLELAHFVPRTERVWVSYRG